MANRSIVTAKALGNILGDKAAVGLVKFFFGTEGSLEMAQELDSYNLLDLVYHEADSKTRLNNATILLGHLTASREKMLKRGVKAIQKNPNSENAKMTAAAVDDLDEAIADLKVEIAALTEGVAHASQWVDKKQTEIEVGLVKDEITLVTDSMNSILSDQVEFTQEMIEALPKTKLSTKIRDSVEKDVQGKKVKNKMTLEVLSRLLQNQGDGDSDEDMSDSSAYAEMLKLAGTPSEKK